MHLDFLIFLLEKPILELSLQRVAVGRRHKKEKTLEWILGNDLIVLITQVVI